MHSHQSNARIFTCIKLNEQFKVYLLWKINELARQQYEMNVVFDVSPSHIVIKNNDQLFALENELAFIIFFCRFSTERSKSQPTSYALPSLIGSENIQIDPTVFMNRICYVCFNVRLSFDLTNSFD